MNVIIVYSKTKRRVLGNFELIGSREDLLSIGEQIVSDCKAHSWSYGSVNIFDKEQSFLPNQEPVDWDD